MRLPGYCIENPVTTIVINLIILLLGLFAFHTVQVRIWPAHESQMVKITATYNGASSELMEESVADVLEDALSGISGVELMTSDSSEGEVDIKLKLSPGVNKNEVLSEVRAGISRATSKLPSVIDTPTVRQYSDADEIAEFSLYQPGTPLMDVKDVATLVVQPHFAAIKGVGDIGIMGYGSRVMRVVLHPSLMSARHVGVNEIKQAIQDSNLALPAGKVRSKLMNFPVTLQTRLSTAKEFASVLVRKDVQVSDVANVSLGATSDPTEVLANNLPVIYINVSADPGANTVQVYRQLVASLHDLQTQLAKTMHLTLTFTDIDQLIGSINEVYISICFAIFCVLLVVFLCLGRLRLVWVPAVAIPISLLGAFFIMYLAGVTINLFTLLALVLAVGLVVDDAIVVLENTQRHLVHGKNRRQASIIGGNEITFPVISMTITLLIVYFPIAFVSGRYADIYLQFAVTLSAAVLISGVVSLTLSPLMCAYTLPEGQSRWQLALDGLSARTANLYRRLLGWVLRHHGWVGCILLLLIVAGVFLLRVIPHEIAPTEELGVLKVFVSQQSGANTQSAMEKSKQVQAVLKRIFPQTKSFILAGTDSPGSAMLSFVVKKGAKNPPHFLKELPRIQQALQAIPGGRVRAVIPNQFSSSKRSPIDFYLTTSRPYTYLAKVAKDIENKMRQIPGVISPENGLSFNSQQYDIKVNTALANDVGISNQTINNILSATFGDDKVSNFIYKNQTFDVVLRAPPKFRGNVNSISTLQVPDSSGNLVPLSQLVRIKSVLKQRNLNHINRLRAAEMTAGAAANVPLDQIARQLTEKLPQWLPSDVGYRFVGQMRQLSDASGNMRLIFVMALLCIYLALSIQFRNFLDPLAILLTVPLCIVGALFCLWITHGTINLYTTIALVTLVGLITKHGILMVQFANQKLDEVGSITEAVLAAAQVRLRPILMTTAAMVMGAFPLLLTGGSGAISRHQIGITIIGGLLFGTFFSLIVVPISYRVLARMRLRGRYRG